MEENYTKQETPLEDHHDAQDNVVVSVVVPMYMCEKYVAGVLDNLCAQTFKDIEIICVVDGSPDQTLARAEECAAKDSRIRVFNQAHGGAGVARNYGLSVAQGKYVMFLDADDVYFPHFISSMVHAIEDKDADIAACCFIQHNKWDGSIQKDVGIEKKFLPKAEVINPSDIKYLLCAFSAMTHNKIFRKSFLMSGDFRFSATDSINDNFFFVTTIISAKKIALVWENLYIYRMYHNNNSITSNRNRFKRDPFTVYVDIYKWLKAQDKADYYLSSFCRRWRGAFHSFARFGVSKDFQNMAVRFFLEEEPWINMSNRELQRMAGLGTEAAKFKRLQSLNRKMKSRPNTTEYEMANREISRRDCEIENIDAIRKQLEHESMRYKEIRDNWPRAAYWRGSDYLKRCLAGKFNSNMTGKKV